MGSRKVKLPTVVYPGGLSPREHAIAEAQAWQREVMPSFERNGVSTPTREYLIVCDLLAIVLSGSSKIKEESK